MFKNVMIQNPLYNMNVHDAPLITPKEEECWVIKGAPIP
jgi:hypothetical protein